MPTVSCERSVDRDLDEIWAFVRDMDHWAPMLMGYEGHTKQDDRVSTWTLRGDLGPMSRSVSLEVRITEWVEAERVGFELAGIDEAVRGSGAFALSQTRSMVLSPAPRSWWRRLLDWLMGRSPEAPADPEARSHVVFTFEIDAQGPMGPMINAMLGPYAQAVAEALLRDVAAHLDGSSEAAA